MATIYLIENGFIIERLDIKSSSNPYYQLSDRGRELKNIGNLNSFYLKEKETISEKYRQGRRDIYLFWVNFWIAVGAVFASLYYISEIVKNHYRCYYGIFQHYIFPILVLLSIVLMILSIWKVVKNLLLK